MLFPEVKERLYLYDEGEVSAVKKYPHKLY